MDGTKDAIRREMRLRRRALPPDVVQASGSATLALLRGWEPFRDAELVLLYVAIGNELPTHRLIEDAWAAGKRALLPRVSGSALVFADHDPGAPMCVGSLGIPEPTGEAAPLPSEERGVVFVPLLAWDGTGARLGRGAGFYDRALPGMPPGWCRVGLGYDFQRKEAIPVDPWDVRLDYVVTGGGIVRCSAPGGGALAGKENASDNGMDIGYRAGGVAGGAARPSGRALSPAAVRGGNAIGG